MKKILFCFSLLLSATLLWAQSRTVTGKIVNEETNEPVAGASIVIKGTAEGVSTDLNGKFTIRFTDRGNVELEITSTGFISKTVKPAEGEIVISLKPDTKRLEEVVVIGYGQVKKRDLTGSVVSVKSEEIKKVPAANFIESLQGKIPGADITRVSGSASSGMNILIRGNRSISASNNPLVIVDGIQHPSLQDVNANDIQSVEVLKDASSTSIYGSRGANGVIIITTKKGYTGKPRIFVNSYYGESEVSDFPSFMNATQYRDFRREANRRITLAGINPTGTWLSDANDPLFFNALELSNLSRGVNTDYLDLLFQNGSQQEHQVGVSAGNEKTKVYLSVDYYGERGVLKYDDLKRYSGRLNVDQTLGRIARAGLQFQYTYYDIGTRVSPVDEATKVSSFSAPYDSTGNIILSPNNDAARWNPLADEFPSIIADSSTTISRTMGVAFVELLPFKGFSVRSNFGVVISNTRTGGFFDNNSLLRRGQGALALYTSGNARSITWENIFTYNKQVKDHNFTVTGVTSFFQDNFEFVSASGQRQILPSQLYYALGNATDGIVIQSGFLKSNLVSYTGRINYSYKGKYLASASLRADGSSKLGEGNKWDAFSGGALGWRISDERFLATSRFINELKLRVSYGITGSDAIRPYKTQSGLVRIPNSFGDNSALGFAFSDTLGNPDLAWEKTKAIDIGIDFRILDNRITGSFDFYKTNTYDLLLDRSLPPTSGVSRVTQNVAKTANTGFEVSLSAAIIRKRDVAFNAGVTFYTNKEKIKELVGGTNDVLNQWFIGSPVQVVYDYRKIGIWQLADSAEALLYGQRPGDIRVNDRDGSKSITANDREIVGQQVPKWNASLNLDFRYKDFDLNVFLFARVGQMIQYNYNTRVHLAGRENGAVVNYWTPENPSNDFPHPRSTVAGVTNLLYGSTLANVDGSFLKIRSITMGYTLPKTLTTKYGISNLRFYVSGKNLFSFSRIKDYDVERGGSLINPLTRLVLAGLNVEF